MLLHHLLLLLLLLSVTTVRSDGGYGGKNKQATTPAGNDSKQTTAAAAGNNSKQATTTAKTEAQKQQQKDEVSSSPKPMEGVAGQPTPVESTKIDSSLYVFALASLEVLSPHGKVRKIVEVTNVTKQTAEGSIFEFTLGLVSTNCDRPKSWMELNSTCQADDPKPTEHCTVKVCKPTPWLLTPLRIEKHECKHG